MKTTTKTLVRVNVPRHYSPLAIEEICGQLRAGKLESGSVVIEIDAPLEIEVTYR